MPISEPQHGPLHVLVTGAAGFIGSHVVERLLAHGHSVTGVDNFDPFYAEAEKRRNVAGILAHDAFRLIETDCARLDVLETALAGRSVDVVVHLAAKPGVRPSIADPVAYAHANVLATQAMLELTRRAGTQAFVLGSSSSVYGDDTPPPFVETAPATNPISPYAATKRAGELLCRAHQHLYGGNIMALRFFTVYGPRQRPDLAIRKFATKMLDGAPIQMYGNGSSERDYTWIDDIVDGVIAAIAWTVTNPAAFEIVNLGENRTTSLARLIELIADAVGVDSQMERLPPQPGDVHRTCADIGKAKSLLGYNPSTTVEEGIPRFVEWLKAHREAMQETERRT